MIWRLVRSRDQLMIQTFKTVTITLRRDKPASFWKAHILQPVGGETLGANTEIAKQYSKPDNQELSKGFSKFEHS